MTRTRSVVYVLVGMLPMVAAFVLLLVVEPFPSDWLDPANEHYWANLLRAFALLVGGVVLGLIAYTMVRSVYAEDTVTGGHPRKLLYRHVTVIASAHGFLVLTLLFYVRERVNHQLSAATPVAFIGLFGTIYALALMIGYQNSRLRKFHVAKQILGTVAPEEHDGTPALCIHPVGAMQPMSLAEWLHEFETGELVRLTVEKVEEVGVEGGVYTNRRKK